MQNHIKVGEVHHVTLTVSDPDRSREFYVNVLGFQQEAEFDIGPLLRNGSSWLLLFPAPNEATAGDRFDENRIGLQTLGFSLGNLQELQQAEKILDALRVPHGIIQDFGPEIKLYSLLLRDPDNIQIELVAPYPSRK